MSNISCTADPLSLIMVLDNSRGESCMMFGYEIDLLDVAKTTLNIDELNHLATSHRLWIRYNTLKNPLATEMTKRLVLMTDKKLNN